jgi:hypothetical protein
LSEAFLDRWSRLKQESRRQADAPPEEPEVPPAAAGDAAHALSPEEIAALPRIEELTAASDVTVFLRPGVPDALRKAALRRAWLIDPAIRDFVGHARDYAYDWNVPGGAPGHGPLEMVDDVVAMVDRVLGQPPATEVRPADTLTAAADADAPAADEKPRGDDDHA